MRTFHIAIGTSNIEASIEDYPARLGHRPEVVVPGEYALWRTEAVNFSIRKVSHQESGTLRHLGWQDSSCGSFSTETDVNGIAWEQFSTVLQDTEIQETWPQALDHAKFLDLQE